MSKFLYKIYLCSILFIVIHSQMAVLSPYNLVTQFHNRQIEMAYGRIGLLTNFYIRGNVFMDTITQNRDACTPLTGLDLRKKNNTIYEENFKILLAYRGSCSFSEKARNAQNAGASMLIVINTGDTPINEVIFTGDSSDIYIPLALINYSDGKIFENFINVNQNTKILAEVNFAPKKEKKVVDFKLFFSASEPKAYNLLGYMKHYLEQFGEKVNFTPYYVVHKNPYYMDGNTISNKNCLSKGVYCYFPKETTIIQEGQTILLEDLRQKCMFKLSKEKSVNIYLDYMSAFSENCVNSDKKSLSKLCSQTTLAKMGFPDDYLDKCVATSFGVSPSALYSSSYFDKENTMLKEEYEEIIKYQLTSFPAVVINDKVMDGVIKETKVVEELCNNVKSKPSFCNYLIGGIDGSGSNSLYKSKTFYFVIFILIAINISLFFMCRNYILEKVNDKVNPENIDINGRIKNAINNYFALKSTSDDYKAFDTKSYNEPKMIEMKEGKVSPV